MQKSELTPATDFFRKAFVILSGTEIIYADEAFLALVGAASRENVLGRDITDLVVPDYAISLHGQIEAIEAEDAPALAKSLTLQTVTDDTQDAVALLSLTKWDGSERVQVAFLNTHEDTPDREGTVHNRAINEAPIGITISDPSKPDNPLIYVNDGFLEQTGYAREEVIGRNCRFLQGEQTREEPVAKMRAAIDAEEPVTVTLRNYRKDGSMFWNQVTIVPVKDQSGAVSHYVGYQQDVTDAKLHEQEKELFKKQAEATSQAIFVTDREGIIVYVNPAFEEKTGFTASEAIGETPRILKSGEQDQAFYTELWETITQGEVWEAELTNETKYGERYEVKQTIVPITDDRGEITHFASIERDITDRVLREQTLNVLNRVLRHNLRSAITVIEGHAEILANELEAPDRRAAVSTIQNQTRAMNKISDRTATIRSLSEQDGVTREWDTDHLETLVERYRKQYPEASFDMTVTIDDVPTLPNSELFELALDEAIDNAIVHTEASPPRVRVTVTQEDSDHVTIRVADNGPGIPDNERHVLKAGVETPLSHGTGIGLWIMQWVATSLGGTLELSDGDSDGATVTFRLPLAHQ